MRFLMLEDGGWSAHCFKLNHWPFTKRGSCSPSTHGFDSDISSIQNEVPWKTHRAFWLLWETLLSGLKNKQVCLIEVIV